MSRGPTTTISDAARAMGRAGRGASKRRGDSDHYRAMVAARKDRQERPVIAVRHAADGSLLEGWPIVGRARTLTEAIRLTREAGYTVVSRRTPGYCWDRQSREIDGRDVDCWSVPVRIVR